ncbi:forespore capture DNA-binding protein RefZ [Terrilactibacillus tamarindi]|nr:forespore capture DNA-binding protein RefZ [Terrilactibacillus tamarindi]
MIILQTIEKVKDINKKNEVIRSAIRLFNMSGYTGTSVRAIANDAGVNIALISYYFGGKKGLLEYLMSSFFEGYLEEMESAIEQTTHLEPLLCTRLIQIADRMIRYQQRYFYLSRCVHREMTLDTNLIREFMASYLMKEKYLLEMVFKQEKYPVAIPIDILVMQYRDMIIMPFLHPQYIRRIHDLQPHEDYFRKYYLKYIKYWADQLFAQTS